MSASRRAWWTRRRRPSCASFGRTRAIPGPGSDSTRRSETRHSDGRGHKSNEGSKAEFKKGLKIQFDGAPYTIVDFQHVKPGKGGAFVRTKLKHMRLGGGLRTTF